MEHDLSRRGFLAVSTAAVTVAAMPSSVAAAAEPASETPAGGDHLVDVTL